MPTHLELMTEPVASAFEELDGMAMSFLNHLRNLNATPLCRGHAQSISLAADTFTGQCLETPYVVLWRPVVAAGVPALQEFEFTTQHEGTAVVLTRVYLGKTGKLSLDSAQLVPLCDYDDPDVARTLAGLVLTGLMSSVIYAPRDRIYVPDESGELSSDSGEG